MNKKTKQQRTDRNALYLRNFVFGVEDSLVSTVGLLSGIAAGGVSAATIFLTGAVLIFVEAFSMAVGSMLSEQTVEEYERKKEVSLRQPFLASLVMFFSYFIAGFIPLFPYALFASGTAFWISIAGSLVALFLLGLSSGRVFKGHVLRHGLEMLCMGGIAIVVGIVVGALVNTIKL